MTAIAGIWDWQRRPGSAQACARMLQALADCGPDHQAWRVAEGMAMGRCLMRLLPEDAFDDQPLGDGGRLLVADLRLDNREDLVRQLAVSSAWAQRAADAALLYAALEQWGAQAVEHIVGDYAFAYWDGVRQRLLLARDPFGQRPLYMHCGREFFAFASMPKGLHALAGVPYAPDLERLAYLIALEPFPGSRTFFAGIERVELGHTVEVTPGSIISRRHWEPQRRYLHLKRPEEYAEALREHLDQAVFARLRGVSDVASQMSGGLDSTSVTATAARLQAARGRRVVAFTAAPRVDYPGLRSQGRMLDESGHAAAVAALHPNIEHVVLRPDGRGPVDDLELYFRYFEKPLFNLCNGVWLNAINDAVRARGIQVLLVGDLGNPTISYGGWELLSEVLARGELRWWWREASALVQAGYCGWSGVLAAALNPRLVHRLQALRRWARGSPLDPLAGTAISARYAQQFVRQKRARPPCHMESWSRRRAWLQRDDRGNENKGTLAAWHIDRRDPTADRRLVEFCLSVPPEQYLRQGVPAALLRHALAERLPPTVLAERRKGLQAVDWHESLTAQRERVRAELQRLSTLTQVTEVIDIDRLQKAVEDWPRDGWDRDDITLLYRSALLRGIAVGHFIRRVVAGHA
jgi:asparagine synthase (glutamine-hydrolysing)